MCRLYFGGNYWVYILSLNNLPKAYSAAYHVFSFLSSLDILACIFKYTSHKSDNLLMLPLFWCESLILYFANWHRFLHELHVSVVCRKHSQKINVYSRTWRIWRNMYETCRPSSSKTLKWHSFLISSQYFIQWNLRLNILWIQYFGTLKQVQFEYFFI